jgi:hypothetical protein
MDIDRKCIHVCSHLLVEKEWKAIFGLKSLIPSLGDIVHHRGQVRSLSRESILDFFPGSVAHLKCQQAVVRIVFEVIKEQIQVIPVLVLCKVVHKQQATQSNDVKAIEKPTTN